MLAQGGAGCDPMACSAFSTGSGAVGVKARRPALAQSEHALGSPTFKGVPR